NAENSEHEAAKNVGARHGERRSAASQEQQRQQDDERQRRARLRQDQRIERAERGTDVGEASGERSAAERGGNAPEKCRRGDVEVSAKWMRPGGHWVEMIQEGFD